MRNLIVLFYFLFIGNILTSIAQSIEDNKEKAELLEEFNFWCSENAAYKTYELGVPQPIGTCYDKSLRYGKWFKFKALTTNLEIILKLGGSEGTLQFPYIHVWDENLKPITCKAYDDADDDMTLTTNDLIPGKWHYITINNHNKETYQGTFTLCVNNQISNDFKAGAVELTETTNWCSAEAEYTTKDASADEKKASCLSTGPNFNRWFKFKAKTKDISVTIQVDGTKGTAQFPYIALYDENLLELGCGKYKDEQNPIQINSSKLIPNKWYYITVDHQYNKDYPGTFTLCLDDKSLQEEDKVQIIGKIQNKRDKKPMPSLKMDLLNEEEKILTSTHTDNSGKFRFDGLVNNRVYFVRTNENLSNVFASVFITDNTGKAIKKTVKKSDNLFAFMNLPSSCGLITLLDCENIDLTVNKNKTGILGRVVEKNQLTDGIKGVSVYLYDSPDKVTDSTKTDADGSFEFNNLSPEKSPLIKLNKTKDEAYTEIIVINDKGQLIKTASSDNLDEKGFFKFELLPSIKVDPLGQIVEEDVKLNVELTEAIINSGKTITLKNLYFDEGKYELLAASFKELNQLVNFLNKNPKASLTINGHTDNTGSFQLNQKLSVLRAKAVSDYLLAKGIKQNRIAFKGYGGTKPVADNTTEQGRKANRRVEILVSE